MKEERIANYFFILLGIILTAIVIVSITDYFDIIPDILNENKIDLNTAWGKICQIKNGTFINETNNCILGNKTTAKRVYWSVCREDNAKIKWTYYSNVKINLQQPNDVMESCSFAWMDIEK